MGVTSYACKDTFWNRLRAEQGFKIEELAEHLHLAGGTVGAYFTGEAMPKEAVILALCDLFDVDPVLGEREFKRAHDKWVSESHKAKRIAGGKVKQKEEPIAKVEPTAPNPPTIDRDSLCKLLYGELPYEEFKHVTEAISGGSDTLELLYGKVGYKKYCEIEDLVKGV